MSSDPEVQKQLEEIARKLSQLQMQHERLTAKVEELEFRLQLVQQQQR